MLCSCGGRHSAQAVADAGEPAFLDIFERPQGGWTVVSVSPFDGSKDSLVVDRPLRRLIVMSTSHYGFLDALGRTDLIVGASGTDYIFTDQAASETSSGGSTASLRSAPPLAPLRSAPVPPLNVPRVAVVSQSRLVSAAQSIIGEAAVGLATESAYRDSERSDAGSLRG
ncbi:MAG: hypothetical protein IJK70_07075, partial [Bacteroidales bacterium]|nr:hypothetical protein [Bacteroidales bacterium]